MQTDNEMPHSLFRKVLTDAVDKDSENSITELGYVNSRLYFIQKIIVNNKHVYFVCFFPLRKLSFS